MKEPLQIRQGMTAGIIVAAVTVGTISAVRGFSLWETVGVATGCLIILGVLYLVLSAINRRRR